MCPYGYEDRLNGSTFKYILCKLSKDKYNICTFSHMCIKCGKSKMKDKWTTCVTKRKADNGEIEVPNK